MYSDYYESRILVREFQHNDGLSYSRTSYVTLPEIGFDSRS